MTYTFLASSGDEPVKESPVTKSKYECCVCHKTYSDISFTIRHIKYHVHRKAAVAEPSLHCGQCGKGFATKQQLNKHETVHTDERPFKCEVCDKWFKTLDNVKRHMYVHNDEKPFACPTCGKEFKAKHMLKKHVETHNDSRLFECPQCEKKYKAKNSLRDHLRVHSGQRPYKCQQCDQAFYRPSHLATHKLVHSKLKPYSCKDCKKTFGRREHLKVHERIHSGEKPFKCMSCDRSFNQQAGLQAHLVSHSEERPHCCLKCNKTFKYQSQVKHHSCKPEDIELGMVGMNENRENKGTSGVDMDTTLTKTKTSMTGGNCGNERIMDGGSSQVSDSVPCLNTTNTIILIQIQNAPEGSVLDETTTGTQRIIGIQDGSKRSAGENGSVSQHCADVLVADQLAVGETSTVSEDQTQGIMVGIEEMIATELLEKI